MKTFSLTLIAAALAALLLACGGGGTDEEVPNAKTPPADCKAHPELCK